MIKLIKLNYRSNKIFLLEKRLWNLEINLNLWFGPYLTQSIWFANLCACKAVIVTF